MNAAAGVPGELRAVLVVAADLGIRRALAKGLASSFSVEVAEDAETARGLLGTHRFAAALVDAGIAVAMSAELAAAATVVVALGAPAEAAAALDAGAISFLPVTLLSPAWVAAAVGRAADVAASRDAALAGAAAAASTESLVAESPGMRVVLRILRRAANGVGNVLVLGEPGSGVSLVARRIHAMGPRAHRPLREVPAADLAGSPRGLDGFSEEGDDLIVDGLHELDRAGQEVLVAHLRSRERAPGTRSRLIATAPPSLRELARQGVFQRDLFHALAAVLVEVPPLRDRQEDLPLLAHLLLARSASRLDRAEVRRVGAEALRLLRAQPWPGNVSELAGVLDRAVLEARGEVVLASHLPFSTGPRSPTARREADELAHLVTSDCFDLPHATAKEQVVSAFDRAYAEALLRRAAGNTTQAARAAGMDRSNFKRLLRRARGRRGASTEIDGLASDKK